jgi:hypothetical protein
MQEYRSKIYYQDHQIAKNLFTTGKEFMTLSDWKEYTGPYHVYSTGEVYTEAEWHPKKSTKLVRYRERSESYFKYIDIKYYAKKATGQKALISGAQKYDNYKKPISVFIQPTNDDYTNGFITRHFAYKRNERNQFFVEVDKKQTIDYYVDRMGMNQYLYGLFDITWKLTGPEFDIKNSEGNIIEFGVVDTNKRTVARLSREFPILAVVLNNPKQFSKYDV